MTNFLEIKTDRDGVIKAWLMMGLPAVLFTAEMIYRGHFSSTVEDFKPTVLTLILWLGMGFGAGAFWLILSLSDKYLHERYPNNFNKMKHLFRFTVAVAVVGSLLMAPF